MKKIVLLLLLVSSLAAAQELQAVVNVNFQNLPVINKESLTNFAKDLETYINSSRYTSGDWKGRKIPCTFNISITSASDEMNYSGQVVITSQRKVWQEDRFSPMLRVLDNNWNFAYEKNQAFYYNPGVFNSITSFVDYYAYIIIGLELDSWEKLSGSPWFQRAYELVALGSSSRQSVGWQSDNSYNRRDLVDNILNEKYRPVREGIFDYHYGVDFINKKKQKAQERVVAFIRAIESIRSKIDVRSVYLKTFFDAKHAELLEMLRDYPDKAIFKTLKGLDPAHASKYDEVLR